MATPKGYSSYRGRRSLIRAITAVVLTLVILAAVGFLVLQKYLVYDDSGKPHFQLPQQTAAAESGAASSAPGDVNLTIDAPAVKPVSAVQLPQGELSGWNWDGVINPLIASPDNNALAVTVKAPGGRVYYASAEAALKTGQTAPAAAAQALAAVTGNTRDKTAIARISCFRDSTAARADTPGMGLKNSGGYLFYDGSDENWLDPNKPAARQYLTAIAKECADMGFDELLLTDVSYPTVGKLNKIDYGGAVQTQALAAFLTELKAALADTQVTVVVELPAAAILSGSDAAAGVSLAVLAPLCDGIAAQTDPAEAADLAAAVTAAGGKAFLPEYPAGTVLPEKTGGLLLSAS